MSSINRLKIIFLLNIVIYYLCLCSIYIAFFSPTYLETFHKDSDTRNRSATEEFCAVAFAPFRVKIGSFHSVGQWPASYYDIRLFHELIVSRKLFLTLNLSKYIRMFFSTHYLFCSQLLIACTLPKSKAAPYAFDKTENFGALWNKSRGPSPVLIREVPTSQRTSVHLRLSGKLSRKVQLWLTYLKNICYAKWSAGADRDRLVCSSHL